MQTVSQLDANTHLSRLIDQIATGAETEIVVSRNGEPVAGYGAMAMAV
jgi:antitoxin (DNA-binding transcriptional repressor) of toxin-antitoxin stability system